MWYVRTVPRFAQGTQRTGRSHKVVCIHQLFAPLVQGVEAARRLAFEVEGGTQYADRRSRRAVIKRFARLDRAIVGTNNPAQRFRLGTRSREGSGENGCGISGHVIGWCEVWAVRSAIRCRPECVSFPTSALQGGILNSAPRPVCVVRAAISTSSTRCPVPTATDPLLRFRDEFPILATSTYLVSNSLGAMPRAVEDRLADYAAEWKTRGVRAWAEGWWEMPVRMGSEIAPLIGAPAGTVVMVPTVTHAMSSVLSAIDFPATRNEVVMTALDFPSVRYAYDALAPKLGARVTVVPSDDGISIPLERILSAITERTRLVAISHVLFRSAYVMDAEAICARARAMGAMVALDAYHSVGVMPVDVTALEVDFLCGGVLKWLCGGPGGCFLYAAPKASEQCAPALTGWQGHRHPFAFADQMDPADGAWRWLGGTPVIPALFAGLEGPRVITRATLPAIRAKSLRQTAWLVAAADDRQWTVNAPRDAERRGGTVAFDMPHAAEVARALLARDVVIDFRPGAGIRVAPHFYTTDEELHACVDAIDDIVATGDWTRFTGVSSTVT